MDSHDNRSNHVHIEAAKRFLDELNEKQQHEMKVAIDESANEISKMQVDLEKVLKNMKRWLRLYLKRHQIEYDDIHAMFSIFDENGDGVISRHEFSRVLTDKLDLHFSEHEVAQIVEYFDVNQDGAIDYTEFVDKMLLQSDRIVDVINTENLYEKYSIDHSDYQKAAIQIQKSFRGFQGRQHYTEKLLELFNDEEIKHREKQLQIIESHEQELQFQHMNKQTSKNSIRNFTSIRNKLTSQQDGSTVFHILAFKGNLKLIKEFMDNNNKRVSNFNLNIFTLNNYGETCLHLAAAVGSIDVCLYLVEVCGLSVKSKTYFGDSVIDYAIKNEQNECVNVLIKYV
eukprot:g7933.t1